MAGNTWVFLFPFFLCWSGFESAYLGLTYLRTDLFSDRSPSPLPRTSTNETL
jgi:hypothetical protein